MTSVRRHFIKKCLGLGEILFFAQTSLKIDVGVKLEVFISKFDMWHSMRPRANHYSIDWSLWQHGKFQIYTCS